MSVTITAFRSVAMTARFVAAAALVAFVSTFARAARDVTASACTYLANHLTPRECLSLVAHLYATGLEPTAVKELERHLPATESCLSLITTWNDGDGKDKSFVSVADGLRKIGRDKLADWLSDTVFTRLSMEMKSCFLRSTRRATSNASSVTATVPSRSTFRYTYVRLSEQPRN